MPGACVYLTMACIHDIRNSLIKAWNESCLKLPHGMETKQPVNFQNMDSVGFTEGVYAESAVIMFNWSRGRQISSSGCTFKSTHYPEEFLLFPNSRTILSATTFPSCRRAFTIQLPDIVPLLFSAGPPKFWTFHLLVKLVQVILPSFLFAFWARYWVS